MGLSAKPNQSLIDRAKPLPVPPQLKKRPPPKPHKVTASEIMSQDGDLIDGMFLVMNGIPFDVAFSIDADERLAWVVIIGTLKGLRYDWATRRWQDPK